MAKTLAHGIFFTADDQKGRYQAVIDDSGKTQMLTINTFTNRVYVDIRDWFTRPHGQRTPTKRGVTLTVDEWVAICNQHSTINEAISNSYRRMLTASTPVIDSLAENVSQTVAVTAKLNVSVVPAFLAPNAKKNDCGIRIVIEKTTAKPNSAPEKKTVALNPLAWLKLMLDGNRNEIQSIITTMHKDITAATNCEQADRVKTEASMFNACLDLPSLQ